MATRRPSPMGEPGGMAGGTAPGGTSRGGKGWADALRDLDDSTEASREFRTLVDVLRWRATHQQDRLAYRFLPYGESPETSLTYGDLNRRARTIGAVLQSLEADGERALLVYPPGLDFICAYFGCLYAGAIAMAVQPPHPARMRRFMSRVAGMANDAKPSLALTTSSILEVLGSSVAENSDLRAARWLATDDDLDEPALEWRGPAVTRDDLAFLQYTSGSTTEPKGVMVSHGNLMHNLRSIQDSFGLSSDSEIVTWLPPYHDMGLIGGILSPLHLGVPGTLMPTVAFVQRPSRWLQTISRFKGTASGGPNFAYDLCVQKTTPEQRAAIDLSGWEVAFNGAEPVNFRTIERFSALFEPCGFHPEAFMPCYGLAESTLLVSAGPETALPSIRSFGKRALEQNQIVSCAREEAGVQTIVACGGPVDKTIIADPDSLTRCPPNRVGEIWVSGPSVARGYWNHPAETEHTFRAFLTDTREGPFLRTGDLGFLLDRQLYVTGRLKDLIIIDGGNHYPQDIEGTVGECHSALESTGCAAFSVEVCATEKLILVVEVRRALGLDLAGIQTAIRGAVSEHHDLQVHDAVLVKEGRIPKTLSGKIMRRACKTAYLAGTLDALETR